MGNKIATQLIDSVTGERYYIGTVGAGEQVDLESMTIKIRGKHGVALLKVFGKAEKPEAAAASFEVVDGILKCKGEGIVVENGILKLPVGEVRDGILYL